MLSLSQLGALPDPFSDDLQRFIYVRTYARWLVAAGRRENWPEICLRVTNFLSKSAPTPLTENEERAIFFGIHNLEVMPSMRLVWSAGPAAERDNVCAYNCAFHDITSLESFSETLYILMCGTGVGSGIEEESIAKLPRIKSKAKPSTSHHGVADSREGWAGSLLFGLRAWFNGDDVEFDYSAIRPVGARLGTMGGRASGPDPLRRLHEFARKTVRSRAGRRLRPIDAGDILCMIGECVVAGGVRRSSKILLFSPDDREMRAAKHGAYWNTNPHRRMANNSDAFDERPRTEDFIEFFEELISGKSGEPGIFNKAAVRSTAPRRGAWRSMGTNPCGEIVLRGAHPEGGGQFCNLSEVVARPGDTFAYVLRKLRLATLIGTLQSSLTYFPNLRPGWSLNCQAERLLGVSITGQADVGYYPDDVLDTFRSAVIEENTRLAARFGISASAATTCVKPSGSVSRLVGSSSGLHRRWSDFMIMNIRISSTDPLLAFLRIQGVPCSPEAGFTADNATTWVIHFPVKSPKGALTRHNTTALEQLQVWKDLKVHFTEHNPSASIYVREDEWITVMAWVWENWDIIGGLSFFPSDDHVFDAGMMPPYQEINELEYARAVKAFPSIDWSLLEHYEREDNTEGGGNGCEGTQCII